MSMQIQASTKIINDAITQDHRLDLDVPMPRGVGARGRSIIRSLILMAEENLSYEIWIWESATHGATLDVDTWVGRWTFLATDGVIETAGTFYRYFIPELDLSYEDLDADPAPALLHISLIPRGAGKTLNKKLLMKFMFQPEVPWS